MSTSTTPPASRWAAFLDRRAAWVLGIAVLITGLLAIPFLTMAPDEQASQEPTGAVFDARDTIDDRFGKLERLDGSP